LNEPTRGRVLASAQCTEFSYNEIKEITSGFGRQIGRGGFGPVFYGRLQNGLEVAVKVLSETSKQGDKEFCTEVNMIALIDQGFLFSYINNEKNCDKK